MPALVYIPLKKGDRAYKIFKSEGWSPGQAAKIIAMPYNRKFVRKAFGGKTTGIDLNAPLPQAAELVLPLLNPKMQKQLFERVNKLKTDWMKAYLELELFESRFKRIVKELTPDRKAIASLENKIADTMKWSGAVYSKCKPGAAACKKVFVIVASPHVPMSAVRQVLGYLQNMAKSLKKLQKNLEKKERDKELIATAKCIQIAKRRANEIVKQVGAEIKSYNAMIAPWPSPKPGKL